MRGLTFIVRAKCAVVALGIVAGLGGCYGTPRTSFPDDDAGGSDGRGGAGGGSSGDARIDETSTACSATCPGPTTGPTTGAGACVSGECRISCSTSFPTFCAASSSCVDLSSDDKNCGICGHDCLGGACAAGQCQPMLIAQYFGNPQTIYVGAEAVYVTTDLGYIGRARKDGSDLKPVAMPGFASSAFVQTHLAEDGDRVFLVRVIGSAIQLSYCQTSGCDATATAIGGNYSQYFAVDHADHRVFWIDYYPARFVAASTTGLVSAVDVPGGDLTSASNASHLLYSQGGLFFTVPGGNSISRIPVSGGSVATVATVTGVLSILGSNSNSLFLYDGSAIETVPLPSGSGGSPKPLVTTDLTIGVDGSFAVDDSSIYWVKGADATTCQIANCSGTQRALPKRVGDSIYDVDVDDRAIYLVARSADANNRSISTAWRLAK